MISCDLFPFWTQSIQLFETNHKAWREMKSRKISAMVIACNSDIFCLFYIFLSPESN